jgi:hypothetical protein
VYNLIHHYLTLRFQQSESSDEAEIASSRGELFTSLQQFLEGSPVGEYETRLRLLLTFHCHALHENASGITRKPYP